MRAGHFTEVSGASDRGIQSPPRIVSSRQISDLDRATEIENARNLYLKAALRLDDGTPFPEPEAAMTKLYGTRLSVDIARDAVQAFGFARDLGDDGSIGPVEVIYRDSKIGEIQKWVIARQILGCEGTG